MDTRKMTGQRGEKIAQAFLRQQGWTILDVNWRSRIGELDIVAIPPDKPCLVIVEVRTKRSTRFGTAAESVDYRKQQKVRRLGLQYAQRHGLLDMPLRFDVVTVTLSSGKPDIVHIPGAF